MFQKRRSMLGRRHLLAQQQALAKAAEPETTGVGNSSGKRRGSNNSWRGRRSEKKRTPSHLDKASKEAKKCLFSKSPAYLSVYRTQGQDRTHHSSDENLLNETGISLMAQTPRSTPRFAVTPSTLQQCRIDIEKMRYGPTSTARLTTKTEIELGKVASSSTIQSQTSYSYDFDNLKPPDSPGPSRLERILLEERLAQASSSSDFYNLKPPDSPGPSRLDQIIMKEKLEQPVDPDLKKMESLSLEDPNHRMQFSPPLSSTCIGSPDSGTKNIKVIEERTTKFGSPDSGKKNAILKEEIRANTLGSGRKLSTIVEDCDVSVIEFELNERTMLNFDNTLMETTINNTVKPSNVPGLGDALEDHNNKCMEKSELSWETLISRLDSMERVTMDRALNNANEMKNLKEQMQALQKKMDKEYLEDISNIRLVKKTLESLRRIAPDTCSTENKENDHTFKAPTCKKKQLDNESKWFNSVKKENPGLLKTPNTSKKINHSTMLTPHSLSNALHDQMNELYN